MPRFGLVLWLAFCTAGFAEQNVVWPTNKRIDFLQRYYSATESSHYVDLWESQNLTALAVAGGLRDTRTLFINAHGKQTKIAKSRRYVLYPHDALVKDKRTPLFFLEDLAQLLGSTNAARIHNIVLSACNVEGALDLETLRTAFVNVTNIIHAAPGDEGFQPMLFQTLLSESARIETLYEVRVKSGSDVEYEIRNRPSPGAKKLPPYIASLFEPGNARPFRTQIAGRELLVSAAAQPFLTLSDRPDP